jgi:benzoyl-CoA reductase/2-hydroxyglutaryl-CoA dehydratase subunit BcrC/BadD/HgdB
MSHSVLNRLINRFKGALEYRKTHPTQKSDELFYQTMIAYYERLFNAEQNSLPIAGATVLIPMEFFYALDIAPLQLETSTLNLQLEGGNKVVETLAEATAYGVPPETCSSHRALIPMFQKAELPALSLVVSTNAVCDHAYKSGEALSRMFNCPSFFIDRPYYRNEKAETYLIQQLRNLVKFLEEVTGYKMDYDRFSHTIEIADKTLRTLAEIYQLRKSVPSPIHNRDYFKPVLLEWNCSGTEEFLRYLQQYLEEIREKVAKGTGAAQEEKYRILFLYLGPYFDMDILDWMEEEHGAMVVMDALSTWSFNEPMDPRQPIESLAKKLYYRAVARQFLGPLNPFIEETLRDAHEFKADGAIFFGNIGCNQGCTTSRPLRDALQKQLNLPTLIIDVDNIDPTFSPAEEVKEKLEGFFELLKGRK